MSFLQKLFGSTNSVPKPQKIAPDFNKMNQPKSSPQQQGFTPRMNKTIDPRYSEITLEELEETSREINEELIEFMKSEKLPYINNPISHPVNIDIAFQHKEKLKAYFESTIKKDPDLALGRFSFIFSEYLVKYLDFKLYEDRAPIDPNLPLVLIHSADLENEVYSFLEVSRAYVGEQALNLLTNLVRYELDCPFPNHYTYGENIEEVLRKELEKDEKKGILLEAVTPQTSDEEANRHNVLLAANIQDEALKEKINQWYRCFSLPDIDANLRCTMQLVRKDIYELMDKSYTGEVVMNRILDSIG